MLLAAFYLVIDVWKLRGWCQPFVRIGANSITIYVLASVLNFREAAARLVGGDVQRFDTHVAQGAGELVIIGVAFLLIFALMGFLYRRKLFVRV